ncbi:HEPN domain-containing protein [Rhizobium sp. SYY.PMSO]|uniref:HEPN domain-containing protein n=1 Tax=Rhizobium sp. SYY.PMSO TaxID=3382192 RepID=UPI00399033B0
MAYTTRFSLVEDYLAHLDPMMAGIADQFIQSRYLGFVLISAVTVYELAIKDIIYEFSDKKHVVLGKFARAKFDQLNGRIKIDSLKNEHIKMFGDKYVDKFKNKLQKKEDASLAAGGPSIKSSYGNIITWRHAFVHQGVAPSTTNYEEIKRAYLAGKEVLHCVNEAMVR